MALRWASGKKGTLSPWSTALAVNMLKDKKKQKWSYSDIARRLVKIGGGHPSKQAVFSLHKILKKDQTWHPGKMKPDAKKRGPKVKFTIAKQKLVARSAMALKNSGLEPTVASVLARCGKAANNPETGESFSVPTVTKVFKTLCYDQDPTVPWSFASPFQKTALPPNIIQDRLAWAKKVKAMNKTPAWYFRNCIWVDPCSTVIPAAKRTVFDQQQATKGKGKRWISSDAKKYSRNLRAAPYAGKQKQWADKRAWWFVVVARDKAMLKMMPLDWQQTGAGIAEFVTSLPAMLKAKFRKERFLPKTIVSDRGPGFYQASSGTIVAAYKEALCEHGFETFAGDEAKWQPPDIPDVLIHETVVAWVRSFFRKHPFKQTPRVERNYKLFEKLLKQCERHINKYYDVDGLCRAFPKRVEDLIESGGDRLTH